jgi:Zn-finger nucleic acid-binding protein
MNPQSLKCPKCAQADLVAMDRNEIEIDVCPSCRGVWLDRGELDKIIERSAGVRSSESSDRGFDRDDDDRRDRDRGDTDNRDRDGRPRRKESWLSNLFD